MPDTVLDTTVLSNFAVIDHLNLLQQHYEQRACTTVAVIEEIQRGIDSGYQTLQPILEAAGIVDGEKWLPVLSVGEKEQEVYTRLRRTLGQGESACLAVARIHRLTFASDDIAARTTAKTLGVRITGTVGILIRMIRGQEISLQIGNDLLRKMIAMNYRAPIARLDDLV